MHQVGSEPTPPVLERAKTLHGLDCMATVIRGGMRIQHKKEQPKTEENLGSFSTLIPVWTGNLNEVTVNFLSTFPPLPHFGKRVQV
jgi:hypothetical protein